MVMNKWNAWYSNYIGHGGNLVPQISSACNSKLQIIKFSFVSLAHPKRCGTPTSKIHISSTVRDWRCSTYQRKWLDVDYLPMMGLFENSWYNTLKLFNRFKMSKTPHMRVPKTIPLTTRVLKYSSTYQGTSVGSTTIYIPIAIHISTNRTIHHHGSRPKAPHARVSRTLSKISYNI